MDGAAFERLCGQVLRKMIPELANMIPSGINMDGHTVKSFSDGFCFIERNHYATIHVTTNSSNLKKKWLYDGNSKTTPKGDLIKGIQQARSMFAHNPAYRFSIFLVSNRPVENELHIEVNQKVTDEFITVKIVEQRDLISFLDYDPEGQYLRKHFLGIDAVRISVSLLADISKNNLFRYGEEIYLKESQLSNVSSHNMAKAQISESATTINLLTGDSGFGKSTLCFALIRSFHEENKVALRIKPSVIEKAISLDDAILQQLINDYPKLHMHAKDIQTLFKHALLIVDDINKSENPTALLDKIISWNQVKQPGRLTVLCPVWPRNLAVLDNKAKKEHEFTVITLKGFSFTDCKAIIQQRIKGGLPELTEQQMHSLIVDSGFDPLLIDFSLQLLSNTQHYSQTIVAEAVKSYVSDKIQQVHKVHQTPVYLISQSLALLGKVMLKNRKLDPHFQDIEKWIGRGSDEYQIIVSIAAQRQLFSFSDEGTCLFRHDRVRDYFLILAANDMLNDFVTNEDVLLDPYYAESIGAAIAMISVPKSTLEKLIQSNPLAVYLALKYLQEVGSESKLATIIDVIKTWNTSKSVKHVPKAVTIGIANSLMSFDVKHIEVITQGLAESAELQLAKFRNGIWQSGVAFFSFIDYFYPERPSYWWNSILAHVQVKYFNQTIEGLSSFLPKRFTSEGIAHAYTLAGFLRDRRLMEELTVSWKQHASPENYPAYLWAILNSFTKDDRQIVIEALSYWNTLTDKQKVLRLGKRLPGRMIKEQLQVVDWNLSDDQIALLFELSENPALKEILALIFTQIDHPKAFSLVLDQEMQRDETMPWHDHWDDRWDQSKTRYKLSEASLEYLLGQFSEPTGNPMRRYLAWRYWIGNVDYNIASQKMQEIVSEQDALFDKAVVWRVKHHDQTAFEAIKKCISRKPWLVRVLDDIWNKEVRAFFEDWLIQQINDNDKENIGFGLELLSLLDNEDACQLLNKYWQQIKWHPRAIGTALFLGTPTTKALADKEVRRLGFIEGQPLHAYYHGNIRGVYFSNEDNLSEEKKANLLSLAEQFKYLHMYFGNKYEDKGERLTREKLEALLPYLSLFDSHSIYQFALDSLRIGAPDLSYDKFFPLLDKHLQKRFRLTVEDLKSDITKMYRELEHDNKFYFSPWVDETDKLGVTSEMLAEAIRAFFNEYKNAKAFFIISSLLEKLGTRKEIALMEKFLPDDEEQRLNVEYWKASAVFSIKRRSLY
jgi:hypothetical protein